MIHVAIADEQTIARLGIEYALRTADTIHVVVNCTDVDTLIGSLSGPPVRPDVAIVDLHLGGAGPCLDTIARLRLTVPVLATSMSARADDVLSAVRAGANGYITKDSLPDQFVAAVHTVAADGFWLSSPLADVLRREIDAPSTVPVDRLSDRERQALDLIAHGYTHAQVANRMGIKKTTVDSYVERIRTKLGVGNKAELTQVALSIRRQRDRV